MKINKINIICIIIVLATLVFVVTLKLNIHSENKTVTVSLGDGMFEWNEKTFENPERVQSLIDELDVSQWYQQFPDDFDTKTAVDFVKFMREKDIAVYALAGSAEWGYENKGKSLIKYIETLVKYNDKAEYYERISGVMVDIEPYTLDKWDENKQKNMETYVNGMIKAYNYAKKNNITMIVCIPNYYDTQGLSEQLETLVSKGCDEVAVMNYTCGNEVNSIKTEANLAQRYNKVLHCILEFQEVGKHNLVEQETYRNKGIKAAQEAFGKVKKAYPKSNIILDYHYAEPLLEMIDQ